MSIYLDWHNNPCYLYETVSTNLIGDWDAECQVPGDLKIVILNPFLLKQNWNLIGIKYKV